jgi:hypothetical protein
MVYHCETRKGSEDIGSGVCRSIIHHDHRQPELETFFNDPTHPCAMVIGRNDNGTPKRYIHEKRNPESTVFTRRSPLFSPAGTCPALIIT